MDLNILTDYYAGRLSPEEEAAVQRWLAEHGGDAEVTELLESFFDAAPPEDDRPALSSIYASLSRKLRLKERRRIPRAVAWSAIAAAVAALLLLPVLYRHGLRDGEARHVAAVWMEKNVPYGNTETLELADGSILQLKAGTRVVYPSFFEGPERKIFVEGGIHADIAKDPDHPFVVSAGDARITVLGTRFTLKSFPDLRCIETMLVEGSVRLDLTAKTGERQILLRPGNLVRFDRETGVVDVRDVDPALFGDYGRGNTLFYFNETVQDIATDLERNFGAKIVVMDEALARSRYFAIFSNGEALDEILAALNADRRMRIARRDGVVYLQSSIIKN